MTSLELFHGNGESLADRVTAVAQGEVLKSLVGDYLTEARTALEDTIHGLSEQTGTAFTARMDGVSALITDPQPKPRVTDVQAFGKWQYDTGQVVTIRERVEVIDHATAAVMLRNWPGAGSLRINECFKVVTEYVLPADPLDTLVASGRCEVVGAGYDGYALIDTETGETVPGTAVTRPRPVLQVRLDKAAKAAAKRELIDALGLPELEGAK